MDRAYQSDDFDEVYSRMIPVAEISMEALASIQPSETSIAAVRMLEGLESMSTMSSVSDMLDASYDGSHDSFDGLLDRMQSQMAQGSQDCGISGRFGPIHASTLMELSYQSQTFLIGDHWTRKDAILQGLTFARGVRYMLQTIELATSMVQILQEFCFKHLKWLARRASSEGLTAENFPNAKLLANFESTYYSSQFEFALENSRRQASLRRPW